MDFYCFLNFFYNKVIPFSLQKVGGSEKESVVGWLSAHGSDKSRLLGVMWQLELFVSEKMSKHL